MRHIEAQLIHDMRNAVSVIQGASDTLLSSARDMTPETVEHVSEMLNRRSTMLVRLLEDLTLVHELDRGDLALRMQRISVAQAVGDYVASRMDVHEVDVEIDVDPHAEVFSDPVRLAQILDNLINNASRYGGPHVRLRAWRDADLIRIAVSDDGPGVPPELVDSLFDLYSRGSQSRELGGSGLGLAIVQQLCQAMGGSIEYGAGPGATFTVSLPAVPPSAGPVSVAADHAVSR